MTIEHQSTKQIRKYRKAGISSLWCGQYTEEVFKNQREHLFGRDDRHFFLDISHVIAIGRLLEGRILSYFGMGIHGLVSRIM